MHRSKLIHLLKNLSPKELKRLSKFLRSPFYNANPHIIKLYYLLRKEYPEFSSSKLDMEKLFRRLFAGQAYSHQKLLNLMSAFTGLLEKYLQALQLEKEEALQNQLLLNAYACKPAYYERFTKRVQKTEKQLDAFPHRDAEYYRQRYLLNRQYFNHPATDQFQLSKGQYEAAMQQLDNWYLLEKLLLSCEMKAREKPLAEQYHIWLLPELKAHVNQYYAESPMNTAYLEMLNLLEEKEASYIKLKSLLAGQQDHFSHYQQQNILQSLINYTIRCGNQGQMVFVKETLELYRFGLDKNILSKNGLLSDMAYISIVNIALRAGEPGWCRQFIDEYAGFLQPAVYQDARSLAIALWLFAERRPEEVIELLQHVRFQNVYYQVQARALLIKASFEAGRKDDSQFGLAVSQAESFERFLRRNRTIAASQQQALLHFAAQVKRVVKLKLARALSKETKAQLRQEFQDLSPLYNKAWLLRQL